MKKTIIFSIIFVVFLIISISFIFAAANYGELEEYFDESHFDTMVGWGNINDLEDGGNSNQLSTTELYNENFLATTLIDNYSQLEEVEGELTIEYNPYNSATTSYTYPSDYENEAPFGGLGNEP